MRERLLPARFAWVSVALLVALLVSGCDSHEICTSGQTETCVGDGGCVGSQQCASDGMSFDACKCN